MSERTLEARQLVALRHCLELPNLTVCQAACLLVGVLPPEKTDDRAFGAWLPGCEVWEHGREAWAFKVASDIAHAETVLRDAGPPSGQSPGAYLALGAKLGFTPPWLDVARADPACHALLPPELQTAAPAERPIQTANRAKARKRWSEDDKQALMRGAGRDAFNRLQEGGFKGCTDKNGAPVIIQVALAVLEAIRKEEPNPEFHPSPRTAERRVKEWLAEDRPDTTGALSDSAKAHMAK